jgi:hypothetical protein
MTKSTQEFSNELAEIITKEIKVAFNYYREALTAASRVMLDQVEAERIVRERQVAALQAEIAALKSGQHAERERLQ